MARKTTQEMYEQLVAVLQSFRDKSVMEMTEDGEQLVFRGSTVQVFEQHGLAGTGYVRVRDELVQLGCIEIKSQGNRYIPSVWYVNDAPTQEAYQDMRANRGGSLAALQRAKSDGTVQLADHGTRIQRLEEAVADIARRLPQEETHGVQG